MRKLTCETIEPNLSIWDNVQPSGGHDFGCGQRRALDLIVPRGDSAYAKLAEWTTQGQVLPLIRKQDSSIVYRVNLPEGVAKDISAVSDFGCITPCIARLKSCRAAVVGADVGCAPTTACVTLGHAMTPIVNVHVFGNEKRYTGDAARLTLPVQSAVKDAGLRFDDGCAQLFLLSDQAVSVHFFGKMPDWARALRQKESYATQLQRKLSNASIGWVAQTAVVPAVLLATVAMAGAVLGFWTRA